MKSLEHKIFSPIVTLIVVIPVLIMIIFNLFAWSYVNRQAAAEIQNLMEKTRELSSGLFTADLLQGNGLQFNRDRLASIRSMRAALQLSKLSINTEIVILGPKGNVLFPTDFSDTYLTEALIEGAIAAAGDGDELQSFRYRGQRYYAASLVKSTGKNAYTVLFISTVGFADDLIRSVNLALLVILLISILVGVWLAISLSKRIARPIRTVSAAAKSIGRGSFITISEEADCAELGELIGGINEMSRLLRQNEKTQKTFLQNASHELRTPLMSIQGYAEGISKEIFADAGRTADIIAEEAKRLNALVEELLTLSRLESGYYEKQFESCNLADAVRDYIQKAQGYASLQQKTIVLRAESKNVPVLVDESLLFRAVYNVLTNAVKYASSQVTVTVGQRDGSALLRIEDDGPGVSPADLPHIFERFYKGKNGSFGLGLAIAKASLEMIGGNITARNAPGAVFELTLPLIRA